MRQQVQMQVHVGGVHRGLGQVIDDRHDRVDTHPADLVAVDGASHIRGVDRLVGQAGVWVPDIEDGVAGQGGQADPAGSRRDEHAP